MANKFRIPRGLYLSSRVNAAKEIIFRWGMAPGLRKRGVKAIDLTDDAGRPLNLKAAIERARELTAALKGGAAAPAIKTSPGLTVGDLLEAFLHPANLDAMVNPRTGKPIAIATRRSYRGWAPAIEETFRDQPIAGVTEELLGQWYDTMKKIRGHAMAYCAWSLMRLILSWKRKDWRQPHIDWKAASRIGMVTAPPAKLRVGGRDELACLLMAMDNPEELYRRLAAEGRAHNGPHIPARPELGDTLVAAIWTTQRKATVLALTEFAVAGGRVRGVAQKNQQHTRRVIDMPQLGPLPQRLADALARKKARGIDSAKIAEIFIHPDLPRAYDADTHGDHFREARALAAKFFPSLIGEGQDAWGRKNLTFTFEDCRDTGMTRLHDAGCTLEEICSWSNHANVRSLMQLVSAYIEISGKTADRAGAKVTAWWNAAGGAV